jgi:hypothetical protein
MSIKRLFIEIDSRNSHNDWKIESSLDGIQETSKNESKDFWWKIVDNARREENLFNFIKEADEIYMDTAIVPLVFGTSIGSPELWNNMMCLATEHKLSEKQIFIHRLYKDIQWSNLDKKLLKKAFKKNFL